MGTQPPGGYVQVVGGYTPPGYIWGKVMFLQVSVILFGGCTWLRGCVGVGMCGLGGVRGERGGMHGEREACVAKGGHAW